MGLKMEGPGKAIIQHLAVFKRYQNQGIGRALIQEAIKRFHLNLLKAETDEESVNFYRKCGFSTAPFKGPYGKRFKCTLE